jgi:WD40 repeat protein
MPSSRVLALVLLFAGTVGAQEAPRNGKPRVHVDAFGDPLPAGGLFRIGTMRLQLDREIQAIAVAADGKRIAAVSDSTLGIFELPGGRAIARQSVDVPRVATGPVLAFAPDGSLAVTNRMQALGVFDVPAAAWQRPRGEEAVEIAFAADGKTFVAIQLLESGAQAIRRWDVATGQLLKEWQFIREPTLQEGTTANYTATFHLSRDARLLATVESNRAGRKQMVRLHDVDSGAEVRRWPVEAPTVRQLQFSADGQFLAGASPEAPGNAEPIARVWEVTTGKEQTRLKLNAGLSTGRFAIAFAPDSDSVFVTEAAGIVRYDWRSGKRLQAYPDAGGPVVFLDGGKTLAAQGPLGALRLLAVASGKEIAPLPRAGDQVAVAPDARHLAWADGGAIVLADATTGRELQRWPAHERFVGPLAFAPDGKTLASAGTDLRIRIWDVPEGREQRSFVRTGVQRLFFTTDGRQLVSSGGWDACLWDIASGKRLGWWYGRGDTPVVAPGLEAIAVPDRTGQRLRLVEPLGGKELHTLAPYRTVLAYAALHAENGVEMLMVTFAPVFSPDSRLLLAGGYENREADYSAIHVWNVASGQRRPALLRGEQIMLNFMAFSPDSRLLVVMRSDRRLALLNAASGEPVRLLDVGEGPLSTPPLFTPDGRTLVTAMGSASGPSKHLVQVWEVATGGELVRWTGHQDTVRELALSADGRRLVTMSADHTALVWDLAHLAGADRPAADARWAELASLEAKRGRRAIEALAAEPAAAIAFLRERLRPAAVPDAKQVARWIDELGSDDFDQRQEAEQAIDRLEELAGPALEKALAAKPSLEARRRIETLMKKLHGLALTPEQVRAIRAVQVLEELSLPEARRLLEALAHGAPEARLTAEASAALSRPVSRLRVSR